MEERSLERTFKEIHLDYARRLGMRFAARGLLIGAACALLWTLLAKLLDAPPAWNSAWIKVIIVLLAVYACAAVVVIHIPSVIGLAKRIDDQLGLGDLLSSWYAFREQARQTPEGRAEGPGLGEAAHPATSSLSDDPMVALVEKEALLVMEQERFRAALPRPEPAVLLAGILLLVAALFLPKVMYVREVQEIDLSAIQDFLQLPKEILSDEERHQFEKIQKMIQELNLEDRRLSRKELLARFSREIEGLDELEEGSRALKSALEQVRESIATQVLRDRLVEEIEEQRSDLTLVDEKTGKMLKAEEIEVMEVQEARRKKQEKLARDVKKVAGEESEKEISEWTEEPEEGAEKRPPVKPRPSAGKK